MMNTKDRDVVRLGEAGGFNPLANQSGVGADGHFHHREVLTTIA